jgi:hypothetical protein
LPLFAQYYFSSLLLASVYMLLDWLQPLTIRNKIFTEVDELMVWIFIDIGFSFLLELQLALFFFSLTFLVCLLSLLFALFILFFLF